MRKQKKCGKMRATLRTLADLQQLNQAQIRLPEGLPSARRRLRAVVSLTRFSLRAVLCSLGLSA